MGTPVADEVPVMGGNGGWEMDIPAIDDLGHQTGVDEGSGETGSAGPSTIGSYVVDSFKHTVKSATGLLPASLVGDVDRTEGEGSTGSVEGVTAKAHDPEAVYGAERREGQHTNKRAPGKLSSGSDARERAAARGDSEMSSQGNSQVGSNASSLQLDDKSRERSRDHSVQAQNRRTYNASQRESQGEGNRNLTPTAPPFSSSYTFASSFSPPSFLGRTADRTDLVDVRRSPSSSTRNAPTRSKEDISLMGSVDPECHSSSGESDVSPVFRKPAQLQSHADSPSAAQEELEGKTKLEHEGRDSMSEVKRKEYSELELNSASFARIERLLSRRRKPSPSTASSDLEESESSEEVTRVREDYRPPAREMHGEEDSIGEEGSAQLLVQPAGFIIRAITFQVKVIIHVVAVSVWMIGVGLSALAHPLNRTVAVKDMVAGAAAGAVDQSSLLTTSAVDGVSRAGLAIGGLSKKMFWGCLSVAYAISVIGLLMIPVIFLNFSVLNRFVEEPVHVRQVLDFDYTQPKPTADVPLLPPIVMEKLRGLPPGKVPKIRAIPASQWVRVSVTFTIPESEYNVHLGSFQVMGELLSVQNQVLLRSSKPCRLRFSSLPVRLLKTILYAGPLLLGFTSETQKVEILLLETQETIIPTASVKIRLEPRARYRDGWGVPDIDVATVLVQSSLPWPKSMLRSWRWTFYAWSGMFMFLFEVGIVLCCCRKVIFPGFLGNDSEDEITRGEVKNESLLRENSLDIRARRMRRANVDYGEPRDR